MILQHIYEFLEVGIVWHVLGVTSKSVFVHPMLAWLLLSYDHDLLSIEIFFEFIIFICSLSLSLAYVKSKWRSINLSVE